MSQGRELVVGRLARARGKVAAALVVCAAVLGLTAGPASAVLYQLPNGHYASYQALTGSTHNPTAPAPSGPAVIPGASNFEVFVNPLGYLNYSGGPVMTSSTNTVVVWQPSNYSGPAYGSGAFCGPGNNRVACTGYAAGVGTYFADLAANSGLSTNSNSVAEQYIANGSAPTTT